MKSADSLDVAACISCSGQDEGGLKVKSCDSASRLGVHTQKIIENDRFLTLRLSKIAHMAESRLHVKRPDQNVELSAGMMRIRPQAGARRCVGPYWAIRIWHFKFSCTIEAHPVRAVFDREDAAQVTMPAPKDKLENPTQRVHQSRARWRRSQLPLASSHSSRERTLARARAIAQSAAP